MSVLNHRFQIRAYFDFGNGEKFSRVVGNYSNYPTEDQLIQDISFLKEFYKVCRFEYARVEKVYTLK